MVRFHTDIAVLLPANLPHQQTISLQPGALKLVEEESDHQGGRRYPWQHSYNL